MLHRVLLRLAEAFRAGSGGTIHKHMPHMRHLTTLLSDTMRSLDTWKIGQTAALRP